MVTFWLVVTIAINGTIAKVDQFKQPDLQTCSAAVWQAYAAHPELIEKRDSDGRQVDVSVSCRVTIDAEEPL